MLDNGYPNTWGYLTQYRGCKYITGYKSRIRSRGAKRYLSTHPFCYETSSKMFRHFCIYWQDWLRTLSKLKFPMLLLRLCCISMSSKKLKVINYLRGKAKVICCYWCDDENEDGTDKFMASYLVNEIDSFRDNLVINVHGDAWDGFMFYLMMDFLEE